MGMYASKHVKQKPSPWRAFYIFIAVMAVLNIAIWTTAVVR